jgi:hypothetical protein
LIAGSGNGGGSGGSGSSDRYDAVQEKLIKKLTAEANVDTAEAMAQDTINKIVTVVKIKKPNCNLKVA